MRLWTMNFKDLVQSLLVYVGIPAVTLYPLGFAALAIQLWNDPLFPYYDFATIWYTVTLVPKTVVVGTALKPIFFSLFTTVLSTGAALMVLRCQKLFQLPNLPTLTTTIVRCAKVMKCANTKALTLPAV